MTSAPPDIDLELSQVVEKLGLAAVVAWLAAHLDDQPPWWEEGFLKAYVATDGKQRVAAELAGVTAGVVKSRKFRSREFRLRVAVKDEEIRRNREVAGRRRARASEALGRIIGAGEE